MRFRSALALFLTAALALLAPLPVLAAARDVPTQAGRVVYDTPAPATDAEATPEPTRRPRPTAPPAVSDFPLTPDRDALTIGYSGGSIIRQAPLLVAQLAGYFDEVGLPRVTISRSQDVLADVLSGDLDIAVVNTREVAQANLEDPTFQAIAGYRNYADGSYGGDVVVAAPGLVTAEPATVLAFLVAYIRALQDLSEADAATAALALIEQTDLAIDPELAADWPTAVSEFAPFDGGFGALDEEGGLAELTTYLIDGGLTEPDLQALIAADTLSIAQAWSGLSPNPLNPLAGGPGITDIVVGLPLADGDSGPISTALEAGYFEDAGFASVELIDVEEPLLGVLQGQLDLGVIDAVDAADGSIQGLPLAALAGHRNYDGDGAYGGDLLVASADVLSEESSTLSAFLVAYLRALADLRDDPTLAPHDGGFGARDQAGGLGELTAYLQAELNLDPELATLIDTGPLAYAQAWWGLPANPITIEEAA